MKLQLNNSNSNKCSLLLATRCTGDTITKEAWVVAIDITTITVMDIKIIMAIRDILTKEVIKDITTTIIEEVDMVDTMDTGA
jgi:hypothetical protein